LNRAYVNETPTTENGMIHSIVFPEKSPSAQAGDVIIAPAVAKAMPNALRRVILKSVTCRPPILHF